ncbi:MAG: bifunctional protein-disulfide isomerase/oxidoreductase DsbC [Congregibacter sp.]
MKLSLAAATLNIAKFGRYAVSALAIFCASQLAAQPIDPAVEQAIKASLSAGPAGLPVERVEFSEIEGLYRVQLKQGPVVYTTKTGDFFILGDMYSVGNDGFVNLGEKRRSDNRLRALDAVPDEEQIVFASNGPTKAHITVFTDVSCFYCQKLHKEVPELNRRGVEVRYLAYPRQGIGSPGFRQLASAWCADDRQTTLTRLKNKEDLDDNVCPGNPVAEQFELGQELGVRGTPAIVMPDGQMIPGYQSAEDLLAALGL